MVYIIHIYVLELEGGYYYVGKSRYPDWRLWQHVHGKGAEWTKVHPPLRRIARYPYYVETEYDEDRYENRTTIETMEKYGWQRVRGGEWCEVSEIETLKKLHRCGYFREIRPKDVAFSPTELIRFIVKLENRKYYVGYTRDLNRTLRIYERGGGPKWLKENRFSRILKYGPFQCAGGIVDNRRDIDPTVIECFGKYGYQNVRGGSFVCTDEEAHRKMVLRRGLGS